MLTFEAPFYEIADVVVFRDHADPQMFYYLAGPPHLSRDEHGNPSLLLLKYREALDAMGASPKTRDELGGGFLLLGVDCGLSEERKSDIKRELESRVAPGAGPISLAPVLYTKGTVNIIALDSQKAAAGEPSGDVQEHARFVRGIQGTSTPSLLQDERAIFSVALSPSAATLIEDAYESDLSPIGVMYELEFAGLRPALAVKAHVDRRRVYDQLKLSFHAGFRSGSNTPQSGTTTGSAPGQGSGSGSSSTSGSTPRTGTGATSGTGTSGSGTTAGTGTASRSGTTSGTGTTSGAGTPPGAGSGSSSSGQPTQPGSGGNQPGKGTTEVALSVDIGYEVEKLVQTGAVTIEIVRQQEGQSIDEMQRNALDLLKEVIINEFFKPAMSDAQATPQSTAAAIGSAIATTNQLMAGSGDTSRGQTGSGRVELGFQLQMKHEEELGTADYDFSIAAPETRTHAPNGFFSALLRGTEKDAHIRTIDLDDPFFKRVDVDITTTADFEAFDLKAIEVVTSYGGTPESPRTIGGATFTPGQVAPGHFQAFRDEDDFTYRYRIGYSFGQSEAVSAQRQSYAVPPEPGWQTSLSRSLVVHPPDDVAMVRVFVEPGVVDWDVVDTIETRLAYDDPASDFHAERTFLVRTGSQRQDWLVRLTDPSRTAYTVQNRWHLKDQNQIEGEVVATDVSHLFVGDPFVDRLPIVLQPLVDKANVVRIDVELQYEDSAHRLDIRKNVELPGPDFHPVTVTIPIMDPTLREFTYRATLIKTNGGAEAQAAVVTDRLSILVTEGGIYFDVQIVVLGKMEDAGIQAIQVDLRSEPLDGGQQHVESCLFEPGGANRLTQRLLLRADRPQKFEYRTTAFRADGDPVESDWTSHENSNLVLQPQRLVSG